MDIIEEIQCLDKHQVKTIEKLIRDALGVENINKNVKIVIVNINEAGANYVTDVFRITAEVTNSEDPEITRHYFFMKVVTQYAFEDDVDDPQFCKAEVFAYSRILEEFSRMETRYGIVAPENRVLRADFLSYFTDTDTGTKYLLFKDLASEGFRTADRNKRLDMDEMKIVLQELAKIHGSSFAMKAFEREKYSQLLRERGKSELIPCLEMFKEFVRVQIKTVKPLVYNETIKNKFTQITENFLELQDELLQKATSSDPYEAVGHGDCWTSNIMFQYNQEGKPQSGILVDWQCVNCHSPPVLDVFHLLVTSFSDEDKTISNFKYLLHFYYENLSMVLGRYSLRAEELYPENVYRRQLKEFAPLGISAALMNLPYHMRSPDDVCSPVKVLECPQLSTQMSKESEERFTSMWNFVLECFDECGLLDLQ